MRSISIRALGALVAVLALSAFASASASASSLPRFESWGGITFTGNVGQPTFSDNAYSWNYNGGEISGEISGENTIKNVTITFKDGNEDGCDTTGSPKYELKWTGLNAHLGYINKEKDEVGLIFEGSTSLPKGEIGECNSETSFIFGAGKHEYAGHLIARIEAVGTGNEFDLRFAGQKGKQEITAFEGETAFPFEIGYGWGCHTILKRETCGFSENQHPLDIQTVMTLKTSQYDRIDS
jgi:hypothetical protein